VIGWLIDLIWRHRWKRPANMPECLDECRHLPSGRIVRVYGTDWYGEQIRVSDGTGSFYCRANELKVLK